MTAGRREHAEVVVIGGGIIGVSTAYHLARTGVDVVLLERGALASGSTSKALGGIRASFNHPANIEMGLYGRHIYGRFVEDFDQPINFVAGGYLYLIDDTVPMEDIEAAVALQSEHGVDTRIIEPALIPRISPVVNTEAFVGALWSPDDAKAEPEPATQGFARAARSAGARLHTNTEVLAIEVDHDRIRSVVTSNGLIATDCVINCGGAWAPAIAEMVGWDLPITPYRRQVITTVDMPDVEPHETLTIDLATAFYFHQELRKFTVGYSDPLQQPGFNQAYDPSEWLPRMLERAKRAAPSLLDLGIQSGYAGLYAVTPDHNQVMGEYDAVNRFLYAAGFSGHGFQMGPAAGRILTELYLGETPFIDVSSLDAARFTDETTGRHETFIV